MKTLSLSNDLKAGDVIVVKKTPSKEDSPQTSVQLKYKESDNPILTVIKVDGSDCPIKAKEADEYYWAYSEIKLTAGLIRDGIKHKLIK